MLCVCYVSYCKLHSPPQLVMLYVGCVNLKNLLNLNFNKMMMMMMMERLIHGGAYFQNFYGISNIALSMK